MTSTKYSEAALCTPPRKRRGERDSKSPTPLVDRPTTPAKKSKQEFVFELWRALYEKTQPLSREGLEFGQLTKLLHDKVLMECTSRFWAVLASFVRGRRLQKGKMRPEMKEARMLLASFAIAAFPKDILNVQEIAEDPLAESVRGCAQDVLEEIFQYSPPTVEDVTKLNCVEAAKCIEDFMAAFAAWKAKDASKVLSTLRNYYEEWLRSQKVLQSSSMNELQRKAVLDTIAANLENTRGKICRVVGKEKSEEICCEIEERIAREAPHVHGRAPPTPTAAPTAEEKKEEAPLSQAEKLAKYGVPSQMRTGLAPPSTAPAPRATDEEKDEDGPKVIDLSKLVMEEASKKYWTDFSSEIESSKFHRLFELLNELLTRLKQISPASDQGHLDTILDVEFLQQTITHGALDAKGFYGLFHGVWAQLKKLQAAADDRAWSEWHDKVVQDMSAPDASWAELLPNVFNKLLIKLDQIEDAIKMYQPLLKKQSKLKTQDESNN